MVGSPSLVGGRTTRLMDVLLVDPIVTRWGDVRAQITKTHPKARMMCVDSEKKARECSGIAFDWMFLANLGDPDKYGSIISLCEWFAMRRLSEKPCPRKVVFYSHHSRAFTQEAYTASQVLLTGDPHWLSIRMPYNSDMWMKLNEFKEEIPRG